MDEGLFIELTNKALLSMVIVAMPILIPALIGGVLISLFQTITQISEQTLTFVPKLLILILSYLFSGPWIIRFVSNYTVEIINRIPEISAPGG